MARVGGEEFGWILAETESANALVAAERARRAIEEEPFDGVAPSRCPPGSPRSRTAAMWRPS
jgi:GGDEF domain-containing protein